MLARGQNWSRSVQVQRSFGGQEKIHPVDEFFEDHALRIGE